MKSKLFLSIATIALMASWNAHAQEDVIRKKIKERLTDFPVINEIIKAPAGGLYEIRFDGSQIIYADATGDHLFQGAIIDTKTKANLTSERVDLLSAIPFDKLPFKDSFTIIKGDGKRKLAVFEDPNCGYCKQFEKGLSGVDNITLSVFLYPILGEKSVSDSKNVWCVTDKGKVFTDWMVNNVGIPVSSSDAKCDTSALTRNVEFGKKHNVTGTPTLFFKNGKRVPSAIPPDQIEKLLNEAG